MTLKSMVRCKRSKAKRREEDSIEKQKTEIYRVTKFYIFSNSIVLWHILLIIKCKSDEQDGNWYFLKYFTLPYWQELEALSKFSLHNFGKFSLNFPLSLHFPLKRKRSLKRKNIKSRIFKLSHKKQQKMDKTFNISSGSCFFFVCARRDLVEP